MGPAGLSELQQPGLLRLQRLREGARQRLGQPVRPAAFIVRLSGVCRRAAAGGGAAGAAGRGAGEARSEQLVGPVPDQHRHGGVQRGAAGGDGLRHPRLLPLLHPVGHAQHRPVRAQPDRWGLGGPRPAGVPWCDHGPAGGCPWPGLGCVSWQAGSPGRQGGAPGGSGRQQPGQDRPG